MLPNACSGPTTEAHQGEGMQLLIFVLPSFRAKFMRATEVFLIVMIGKGLNREQDIFGNGHSPQVVVLSDLPDENRVGWPIEPRGFGLDPVNIG